MKTTDKRLAIYVLGLVLISIAAYKMEESPHPSLSKNSSPSITLPETQPLNPEKLKAPTGLQVQKTLVQHTAQIGTSDMPTFDGGIINAADGIPVMPAQVKKHHPIIKTNSKTQTQLTPYKSSKAQFDDTWATSVKIDKILNRAIQEGKLIPIMKEIKTHGLPAGAALLPIVESQYQEGAVSPKGAVGMWQLMPSLAHDYGLSNQQRFNTSASTTVALRHLKSLYQQFGNWELAYAAYNAGAARVSHALMHNPGAHSIDELNLPSETKHYVHRIQSIHNILLSTNGTDYES